MMALYSIIYLKNMNNDICKTIMW